MSLWLLPRDRENGPHIQSSLLQYLRCHDHMWRERRQRLFKQYASFPLVHRHIWRWFHHLHVGPTYHSYLSSKNPYPLNPKELDIFYFLLICTKWPKRPKYQRLISLSYKLHSIECIPRDNTTLAFLLVIFWKAGTRVMVKSLRIVPIVFDLALTL